MKKQLEELHNRALQICCAQNYYALTINAWMYHKSDKKSRLCISITLSFNEPTENSKDYKGVYAQNMNGDTETLLAEFKKEYQKFAENVGFGLPKPIEAQSNLSQTKRA